MQPSDYAAWWGAIIATLLGFWDFIKWRKGRPGFSLKTQIHNNPHGPFQVMIEITNNQSPLTIKSLYLRHYSNIWDRIFHKEPDKKEKISKPEIPKRLEPGDFFSVTLLEFDPGYELNPHDFKNGIILIDVHGSNKKRPVSKRLK